MEKMVLEWHHFFMRARLSLPGSWAFGLLWAVTCLSAAQPAGAAGACQAPRPDETVRVRHVHDGDTVILADGRKLRLVGYNTPELARENTPAEPLSGRARQQLRDWIKAADHHLQLQYDAERKDRYGRTLAHAFLPDGRSIARLMLERGLATTLILPPNLDFADCLLAAEADARQANRGLWARPAWQPVRLGQDPLAPHKDRYTVLRGRVTDIVDIQAGRILELQGPGDSHGAQVFIHRDDLGPFPAAPRLKGREIEVRGWLHRRRGRWNLRLHHPGNLQIPAGSATTDTSTTETTGH